jgi:hypothetical protein
MLSYNQVKLMPVSSWIANSDSSIQYQQNTWFNEPIPLGRYTPGRVVTQSCTLNKTDARIFIISRTPLTITLPSWETISNLEQPHWGQTIRIISVINGLNHRVVPPPGSRINGGNLPINVDGSRARDFEGMGGDWYLA